MRGRAIAAAEAFDQVAFLCGMGVAVPTIAVVGSQRADGIAGILLGVAALAAIMAKRTATPTPPSALHLSPQGGPTLNVTPK